MARQIIDIGIQGNDGTGDSIRESFRKVNDNFRQLFSLFGEGDTIALTQLDDTPDFYQPSTEDSASILVADEEGVNLVSKVLIGGDGIIVDNSDPNQVTIFGGGGELIADEDPTLGAHLNANNFSIGNICNPEDAVVGFNNVFNQGLPIATADDFVISRGYADRRYLQANSKRAGTIGNQVRVREEPLDRSEYSIVIDDWVGGFALIGPEPEGNPVGHGYNTSVNGSGFVYRNTGLTSAFPLVNGRTYYVRYVDSVRLAIYENREDAINDEGLTLRELVNTEEPIIPQNLRGTETLTDEYYDETLFGNWVGNEALPRSSVVRRQGDDMEGPLYLYDHPGSFSGLGTPNGEDDLQAATKLYVDQSSFASTVNLFVATSGSDIQLNVPEEKKGRALSYAFGSVYKACETAEELINESLTEPGPYRQPITYLSGSLRSTVTSSDIVNGNKRLLKLFTNGAGVDPSKDPNNRDLREGSIIKGLSSGATAKVIDYKISTDPLADGNNDEFTVQLLHKITDPNNFQSNYIISADLIDQNTNFITEQTILYIRDSNPALAQVYDETKCIRDLGFILQALVQDIKFGGNKETLKVAKAYFRGTVLSLPSSQLADTVGAIDYARQLLVQIVQNNPLPNATTPPSFGFRPGAPEFTSAQTITSIDGEEGTVELVNRLVAIIIDILESPDGQGSNTLLDFQIGEELEYGQPVPELQITIRVETGVYYEQLPIRVPANVSIKGDEFRRVIIRPAFGESQSKWNRLFFFRDSEFDGLRRSYLSTASAISSVLAGENIVTVSSTQGLEEGMYLKIVSGTGVFLPDTRVKEIIDSTRFSLTKPPATNLNNAVVQGFNASGLAPEGNNFGYHYLTDPTNSLSRPKENRDMDVFLMNDATILRNISCQGHGGFMTVLDPEGQIQTKSPYMQTATSLSGSLNRQRFAGGMYIDGSSGNLPARIQSKVNNFELIVDGLDIRLPQIPTSFYLEGRRYQVNQVEPTINSGEAVIYLDQGSNGGVGYDETEFETPSIIRDIVFETAGNRSMLANDYTQVNDLGYGCIATNNGISELVSVFTYYCWTSYYAVNGGQIRSTQGNSSYGEYGMRARGRDLTEVPDPVSLVDNTLQVAKVYKLGAFAGKNQVGDISVYIDNYQFVPYNISEIEIDFSNTRSSIVPNSESFPNNIVLVNAGTGYRPGQLLKPVGGITFGSSTFTAIRILTISGGGATGPIATWALEDVGDYSIAPVTVKQESIFNVDEHPANTIALGGAANAQFRATYLGSRITYEVNSIELTDVLGSGFDQGGSPINLPVLKLNLQSNTNSALFSNLNHEDLVIIRGLQNFKFDGIEEVRPVRPSTALEFTEPSESGTVYRTLAYNLANSVGTALPDNQAVITFDTSYDYVILQTNPSRLNDLDYIDGGPKTMGASIGDTRIAVVAPDLKDIERINSRNMIMAWSGKLFRLDSYVPQNGVQSAYVVLEDISLGSGSIVSGAGIRERLPIVEQTVLRAGIDAGSPAEITVRISTCRASGHDFLDVGTGGFVTSNYPNNLYGAPATPKSQAKEVVEETQGRVFYASTDQDGIFRVGRFFTVDQGTGTVTFSASIALSNLDGIGFKRGTVVKEFSTDDTMIDAASDTVPTEGAVVGYISRRLGITPTGAVVPENERIPQNSGFIPVNGAIAMTGNLNMGTPPNRIINLATPSAGADATNKSYVDNLVAAYDELSELNDVTISALNSNQVLIYNGTNWVNSLVSNNSVSNSAAIAQSKLNLNAATTRANATGITQADLGIASFDSANFEITGGWVGIRNAGVSYSEIQNVSQGRLLGNLTGSATSIQEITPSDALLFALSSATTIENTTPVLSVRRNYLNTGAISTFSGTSVSGNINFTDVPATSTLGTGSGARFNIVVSGGVYTSVTVVNGGSGYANGNILTINGANLGGVSGVNDLTINIASANINTGTILGIQRVSIAAESNSIVATDTARNLGKPGNRFATVYATGLSVTDNIDTSSAYVDQFITSGVDISVTATGPGQANAYPISRSITVVTAQGIGTGVRLPNGSSAGGTRILIRNSTLSDLNVFPNVGGEINTLGQNVPFAILSNSALEFFSVSPTQWYTLSATLA